MASLIPVDHDPFAGSPTQTGSLVPVDHDPFQPYNINDYIGDVKQSVSGGARSLADLFTSKPYSPQALLNAPSQYSGNIQSDIVQGNWGNLPKDIAGRVNEGIGNSFAGKLLGGVGGIVGAPLVPPIQAGINKLDDLGVPKEISQLALNASPLLAKGLGGETVPPAEAPVSNAYQQTAKILTNNGNTPEAVMSAAQQIKNAPEGTIPQTLPEVIQDPNLLARQRAYGEQANDAGSRFQQFNQERLGNALPAAKEDLVSLSAGENTPSTLTDSGTQIQNVAKGIIDDAIKQRTEAVKPIYESIKNEPLDNGAMMQLRANPLIENEYQKVLGNDALMERQNQFKPQVPPELANLSPEAQQQAMAQLPTPPKVVKTVTGGLDPSSIGAWDAVKKNLAAQIDAMQAQGRTQEKLYGLLNSARNQVRQTLGDTNEKYNTANDEYASQSPEISAMQKGPLGSLARAQTGENAARAFMNMSREQLKQVVPKLEEVNPDAIKAISSAVLQEVTDKTSGGGIAPYLKALSGNDIIKDRMKVILSPEAYDAQQALVDTLKKIQAGQPRNSETMSKALIEGQAKEESNPLSMLSKAKNIPTSATGLIGKGLELAQTYFSSKYAQQYKADMIKLFIDPDLEQLGRALRGVNSPIGRTTTVLQWLGNKSLRATYPAAIGASEEQRTQKLQEHPIITQFKNEQPFNTSMKDGLMSAFAKAESNNNPSARNPNSSASGLMQFTDGTWKQMVKRYGAETGITVQDRNDPAAQTTMARLYAKDNIAKMQPFLKRLPTKGELYQAHVLGPDGALRLINAANATPDKQAIMLFPRAVTSANRNLFFNGNQPRSVAQLYQILSSKV
jgi:hypothetical protein